jgi:uncharacterized protein
MRDRRNSSLNNPPLDLLKDIFSQYPEIEAVYLFGSVAATTDNADSDLDLAVYPGSHNLVEQKLDLLAHLARKNFCKVDIIYLDGKDIVLNFEAIKYNRVIFAKAGFDRGALFSDIVRKYFDFQPFLAYQRQALKRRLLYG